MERLEADHLGRCEILFRDLLEPTLEDEDSPNRFDTVSVRLAHLVATEAHGAPASSSVHLGSRLGGFGEVRAAGQAYLHAMTRGEGAGAACQGAADLFIRYGSVDDVDHWTDACVLVLNDHDLAKSLISFAERLLEGGRPLWAVKVLGRLTRVISEDPRAVSYLSVALRQAGETERSRKAARLALQLAPDDPEVRLIMDRGLGAGRSHTGQSPALRRSILPAVNPEPQLPTPSAGPYEPEDIVGRLAGDLALVRLPDLIEALHLRSLTGELRLRRDMDTVSIDFEHGRIVSVTGGHGVRVISLAGSEAMNDVFAHAVGSVLSWRAGCFEFTRKTSSHRKRSGVDARTFVLEATRREDEQGQRRRRTPRSPPPAQPAGGMSLRAGPPAMPPPWWSPWSEPPPRVVKGGKLQRGAIGRAMH